MEIFTVASMIIFCRIYWSGRRDSNPRLQPWQGWVQTLKNEQPVNFVWPYYLFVTTESQEALEWQLYD